MERWYKVNSVDHNWEHYTEELENYVGQVGRFYETDSLGIGLEFSDGYVWYYKPGNVEYIHDFTVAEGSKEAVNEALGIDRGSHYRYSFRLNLTEEDKKNGFVMVNIDPYRISEVYKLGGWREHLFKKTVRGTDKGHTEQELIEELQCTINRAKQMFEESKE